MSKSTKGKNPLTRLLAACAAAVAVTGAVVATANADDQPMRGQDRPGARVGERAPDFTLTDLEGNSHTLSELLDGETVVVLEWFNPECPFVKKHYGTQTGSDGEKVWTMNALRTKYADRGVTWIRINSGAPGKQGAGADLNRRYAENWRVGGPILLDESGAVGRAYDARTTPHMFIINREGILAYNGAIDSDRHPRRFGDDNYVDMALTQILAGETVTRAQTQPYGCSVKYSN